MRGERRLRKNELAKKLRRESTDAERVLWRQLRGRRLQGWKFRHQHPVGPYVADFYGAEVALIIEVGGGEHLEKTTTDRKRTVYLEGYGLKVLRFWNDEVLKQTDAVLERIAAELAGETPHPNPLPSGAREETTIFDNGQREMSDADD